MNHLDIVREVVRLASISNSGGPTTTVGQVGDYLKAVKYVASAYEEIQGMYFDWDFLWGTSSLETTVSVPAYTGVAGLGIWDVTRVFYNEVKLNRVVWQDYVPDTSTGSPAYFTIQPDNKIRIGPTPDGAYTISYDYYRSGHTLVTDSDTPLIPAQFHRAIVGRALMLHGNFESAAEIKLQGQEIYTTYMDQLRKHQLARRQQTHGRANSEIIEVVVI